MHRYLSVADTAEYLGISRATLYRWIKNGEVDYIILPNNWTRVPRDEAIRLKALLT